VYRTSEVASPKLLVTIEFTNSGSLFFIEGSAAIDGENLLFYSSDFGDSPHYIDGTKNTYYLWDGHGGLVACPTTAYASHSNLVGNMAVVMASLPLEFLGKSVIAIASAPDFVRSATTILSSRSGGMTINEFYADSRSTTKPEILSIVQSVSDQVTNSHSSTDAYVVATYNQAVGARSQIETVTTVTLPALEREIVSQIISAATASPYKARTAVLLTTTENTSDPTVTGDPLRPWGYPGDIIASENHYRDVNGATHAVVSVIYYDNNLGVGQTLVVTDFETLETWNAALAAPLTVGVSVAIKPWAD
jgi:hypothetical protein